MHRSLALRIAATLASSIAAVPASAHFAGAVPHRHGDAGWGVVVVFALTAAFAWAVRRRR